MSEPTLKEQLQELNKAGRALKDTVVPAVQAFLAGARTLWGLRRG